MAVLDLFCGIGWGQALHELGIAEHGIDFDADVAATRALHGWQTTHADITTLDPADFPCDVLIASPPCQSFSAAGKRRGLEDPRGQLVWQVPRWVGAVRPRVVICEQVPGVLPIWRAICQVFDQWGYRSWCGVLDAVQWGVPQTRKRAILIARLDGRSPLPPEPTHRPYQAGGSQTCVRCNGTRVDWSVEFDRAPHFAPCAECGGLLPWVSMADALGLHGKAGFPRRNDRNDGGQYRDRDWFDMGNPAPTATEKWRSWVVDLRQKAPGDTYGVGNITRPITSLAPMLGTKSGSQWVLRERQANGANRPAETPAPTITASLDNGNLAWHRTRPATTICADPRPSPPVHHHGSQSAGAVPVGEEGADKPIRLTIPQGLTLMGFPADFALAGTKTSQWRQIGNAVAPPFARALLAHHLDGDR